MKDLKSILIIFLCIISVLTILLYEDNYKINFKIEGNESSINYGDINPVVAMKIKGYGTIVIELYPDIAPNTVNNFISLVKSGFYDNNSFHRLVPNYVLQGGDPEGLGSGGPGYTIKGEFSKNGIKNELNHTKYIVSMARRSGYNSAGSQFFIMLGTARNLDGAYAAFGKVIVGTEVINMIEENAAIENEDSGKLEKNIIITKAIVDTKGIIYDDVIKEEN